MIFRFETVYNQKSLSVMAKCMRKTVRKPKSKRSHILGVIVIVLALFLAFSSFDNGFVLDFKKIITLCAALLILVSLIFEDKLNAYFAKRRMLKGTEKAVSTFDSDNIVSFVSETSVGKSEFDYKKILLVAESSGYFVFVFSENHAQIYDKSSISGGSVEEFKEFIKTATGKTIISVK